VRRDEVRRVSWANCGIPGRIFQRIETFSKIMARPIIDNAGMGVITAPSFKGQSIEHSILPSDKKIGQRKLPY